MVQRKPRETKPQTAAQAPKAPTRLPEDPFLNSITESVNGGTVFPAQVKLTVSPGLAKRLPPSSASSSTRPLSTFTTIGNVSSGRAGDFFFAAFFLIAMSCIPVRTIAINAQRSQSYASGGRVFKGWCSSERVGHRSMGTGGRYVVRDLSTECNQQRPDRVGCVSFGVRVRFTGWQRPADARVRVVLIVV